MDDRRFDALSRALGAAASRRGLLRLLAAVPVLGGLAPLLDPDDTDGQGRRHRRKKLHKHGRGRHHHHHHHGKHGTVDCGLLGEPCCAGNKCQQAGTTAPVAIACPAERLESRAARDTSVRNPARSASMAASMAIAAEASLKR
jgi:hypothetical protein